MKRAWIWLGAAVVLIACVVVIRTETRRWHRWCGHHGSWGPAWYATHELNLTDAQRKQIGTIWDSERPRVAGLVRELAAQNAELRNASKKKDDGKVRELVSQQGATVAKLLMEKERMCTEIYGSVLNEEQRKKADDLQGRLGDRLRSFADRLEQGGADEN